MNNTKGFSPYDVGFGFANAFRLLYSKSSIPNLIATKDYFDCYNNLSMIIPTLVNGAFACELFLKALIKQKYKTHSLVKLLTQLEIEQPGKTEQIMRMCIKIMREHKSHASYDDQAYYRDLETFDKSFDRLRYLYEPTKDPKEENDMQYNLDYIEIMVAILQDECRAVYGPRPLFSFNNAP